MFRLIRSFVIVSIIIGLQILVISIFGRIPNNGADEIDLELKFFLFSEQQQQQSSNASRENSANWTAAVTANDTAKPLVKYLRPNPSSPRHLRLCSACSCRPRVRSLWKRYPNKTWLDCQSVLLSVYKINTDKCAGCHPGKCECSYQYPIGVDEAAPTIVKQVSHQLRSIPQEYTVTSERLLPTQRSPDTNKSDHVFLFTYNPTIQKLPASISYPNAAFLATFRVTTVHSCGFPVHNPPSHHHDDAARNLLGLALLDQELALLLDVVIDINQHVGQYSKRGGKMMVEAFEDFRLVHIEDTTYLLTQSYYSFPVRFVTNEKNGHTIPNLFGSGLYLEGLRPGATRTAGLQGKNLNLFHDANGNLLVEIWPFRELAQLKFCSENYTLERGQTYQQKDTTMMNMTKPPPLLESFTSSVTTTITTSELKHRGGWKFTGDRGTACCARLDRHHYVDLINTMMETTVSPPVEEAALPFNTSLLLLEPSLLVGISHVKSFRRLGMTHGSKHAYLSRWYAFSPTDPVVVYAKSGLFCFGYGEPSTQPELQFLELRGRAYDCPAIQFPTGIVEKDEDHLVVAYGINDCSSNMVVVGKREIAMHLFTSLPKPAELLS